MPLKLTSELCALALQLRSQGSKFQQTTSMDQMDHIEKIVVHGQPIETMIAQTMQTDHNQALDCDGFWSIFQSMLIRSLNSLLRPI